jgi:hypothetical protein
VLVGDNMNVIKSSLSKSLTVIRKHKGIIAVLLILQIIFVSLFLGLQVYYQAQALETAQEVMAYLGQQDLGDIAVARNIIDGSNILGDNAAMIASNYRIIKDLMIRLGIYTLIAYLVFGSLMWALTDQLIHKKNKKKFLKYIGKFCALALGFIAVIFLLGFSGLKEIIGNNIIGESINPGSVVFLILGVILVHFMFVSFSLISKVKFKDLLKTTFILGAKKAHIVLIAYIINTAVIFALTQLVHGVREKNIAVLGISLLLLIFSFVWTRIFLFLSINKLKG